MGINNKTYPQKGLTLIELVVAMALGVVLLGIVSKFLWDSTMLFSERVENSEVFKSMVVADLKIEKLLQSDILNCDFNRVKIQFEGQPQNLLDLISTEKTVYELEFACKEFDPIFRKLVPWKTSPQPHLIEYSGTVNKKGKVYPFLGSLIK